VEEYNKLVEVLNGQVNTSRPKSDKYTYYEPLTNEEKEAMSEDQVKKWEEKAKTGMLYRDDLLTGIARQIREMMYTEVVREDGSKISLHQIGIQTSNESGYIGKLQIDEDKLRAALEKDPEAVKELFTKQAGMPGITPKERSARLKHEGLADRLGDIIANAIDRDGSIWNRAGIEKTLSDKNNTMYTEMSNYDEKISDMLEYLTDREDYYYNLFAKMEQAMAQSNQQMSSLMGMLGTGN
jgi:flagellar hook-associated protein 2